LGVHKAYTSTNHIIMNNNHIIIYCIQCISYLHQYHMFKTTTKEKTSPARRQEPRPTPKRRVINFSFWHTNSCCFWQINSHHSNANLTHNVVCNNSNTTAVLSVCGDGLCGVARHKHSILHHRYHNLQVQLNSIEHILRHVLRRHVLV